MSLNFNCNFYLHIQPLSLKPIAHLKKINMLVIGLIDDESYALNYVKLNSSCLVYYIIKGGPIDFENFIFNYDQVFIEKNENQIEIQIEGVEDIEYYPTATKIPECLINDKLYYEKLINSLIDKLSYRLEIILDRKVKIKKENTGTYGNSHLLYFYELN